MKTTGNLERDQMLLDAIAQATALGDSPTLEIVAALLPDDFDLGADELGMFASPIIEGEFIAAEPGDGTGSKLPVYCHEPHGGDVASPSKQDVAPRPPTPADIEEANAAVIAITNGLSESRAAVNIAYRRLQDTIAIRARAVSQFVAQRQPYSPLQQAKDFSRSAQAVRQAIKEGTMLPPSRGVPGPSRADAAAFYSRAQDAEGQGNHRRACYDGRAIYPASKRGGYAGPPKLPSER
jgi:hypothetical protein